MSTHNICFYLDIWTDDSDQTAQIKLSIFGYSNASS